MLRPILPQAHAGIIILLVLIVISLPNPDTHCASFSCESLSSIHEGPCLKNNCLNYKECALIVKHKPKSRVLNSQK
jgi:hypothetical protein